MTRKNLNKARTRKRLKPAVASQVDPQVNSELASQVESEVKRQPQRKPEVKPELPKNQLQATCPVCSQVIPRNQLLKHMWDSHHDYMIVQSSRAGHARQDKKAKLEAATNALAKPSAANKMQTSLPSSESVTGISESPTNKKPEVEEGEFLVEGEGYWVKARVSIKTLMYWQQAQAKVRRNNGADLAIGDFFDICADDYFKGRHMSLELVKTKEAK